MFIGVTHRTGPDATRQLYWYRVPWKFESNIHIGDYVAVNSKYGVSAAIVVAIDNPRTREEELRLCAGNEPKDVCGIEAIVDIDDIGIPKSLMSQKFYNQYDDETINDARDLLKVGDPPMVEIAVNSEDMCLLEYIDMYFWYVSAVRAGLKTLKCILVDSKKINRIRREWR